MRASGFLIARESLKLTGMADPRIRLILMALKPLSGWMGSKVMKFKTL